MALDVGVAQGATGQFEVLDNFGILPNGDGYVCDSLVDRGELVFCSAEGVATIVSGNMAATARLLGFAEQNVVADISKRIEFGYDVQQKTGSQAGEPLTIHPIGRFRVTAVSGTVSANSLVYPGDGGKVQGAQVGSAPAVGVCVVGNSSGGDPIVVEINLIGRRAL